MSNLGENIQFANSQAEVDKINKEFYQKIKYPWAPSMFEKVERPNFWSKMLSQDLGYFDSSVLPQNPTIWVAGCGTNQAIFTALKFPQAHVIGSDLSEDSLSICKKNLENLEINNLELRCESINSVKYRSLFDYIICTGVIHHNAAPLSSLQVLTKALNRDGIIELMVYNKFHRLATSAFQLAIRLLVNDGTTPNLNSELPVAKMIVKGFKNKNLLGKLLESTDISHDAAFADALLQPVEHSYTIASLEKMGLEAGLEMLSFCIDQFSRVGNNYTWNLEFEDNQLQNLYDSLPDTKRWQVSNLLLGEESPLLWFYLQRKDSMRPRKSEKQMSDDFLNTRFKKVDILKSLYTLKSDASYSRSPMLIRFPPRKAWVFEDVEKVYSNLNEDVNIDHTFQQCKINKTFSIINKLRACLATSAFPYLEAQR